MRPADASHRWDVPVWLTYSALVAFVFSALLMGGCEGTMTRYYQTTATTALIGSQCIDVLESVDGSKYQAAKALKIQGDPDGALMVWDEWSRTYKKIKTTCDAAIVGAGVARATGPVVAAALDKDKQAAAWIARLLKWAADVTVVLGESGFKLPGGL